MRYFKNKVSKDGIFYGDKGVMKSNCDKHIILERKREGKDLIRYITFKCLIHGQEVKDQASNIYSQGCKVCNKAKSLEQRKQLFLSRLKDSGKSDDFELLSEYKNAREKVKIKHNICGKTFEIGTDHFLRTVECLYCNNTYHDARTLYEYNKKYKSFYKKEGFEIIVDEPDKYMKDKVKFKIKHLTCGNIQNTTHGSFYTKGTRCSYCNKKNSRVHAIVHAIIDVNQLNYETEFKFDDCKNKYRLPFDFMVNLENGKFLLIEVDGQQHYNKIKSGMFKKTYNIVKQNDTIKNQYCANNNIELHRLKIDDYTTIKSVYDKLCEFLPISKIPSYKDVDVFNTNKVKHKDAKKIRELYLKNITVATIADKYDISDAWVRKVLNYSIYKDISPELRKPIKEKLKFNSNKPPRRPSKLLPYKDEILRLRNKEGLSFAKIGDIYNMSGSAVDRFIKNHS